MSLNYKTCGRCKKKKKIRYFNDVDFGWGNFKKANWCKVCDSRMDRSRKRAKVRWTKKHEKLKREFVAGGGIIQRPIIGRRMMIDFTKNPKGEEIVLCKGWYADDEGWRKRGVPNEYL